MDASALLLSRLQFAFTISFHIIFPAFSIGLAAWLAVLEAKHLWTGNAIYRTLFQFWLKIFPHFANYDGASAVQTGSL